MKGSVARNRIVSVNADGGDIRGVHRDRIPAFAGQVAAVLGDPASYHDDKVVALHAHARIGGSA
jgi:hypothetical protein